MRGSAAPVAVLRVGDPPPALSLAPHTPTLAARQGRWRAIALPVD